MSFKNNKIGWSYSYISTICVGNIAIFFPENIATRFVANKYSGSDIDDIQGVPEKITLLKFLDRKSIS